MKFKVGDWVYLNPELIGRVDTQLGIVENVFQDSRGRNRISVFWELAKHSDDGDWREHWLIKV